FVLPEDDPNYQNMLKNRADKVNALDAKKIENDRKMVELEGAKDRMEIENEMKRRSTEADADAMETWELRKAEIAAKRQIMEAEAMKAKRELEGYTYQEEQSYNIAKTFADKQGGSDMVGLGVGLGAMTGIGASVGSYLSGSVTQAMAGTAAPQMKPQSAGKVNCSKCGAELPENAKFCLECGEKVVVLQENEMICPSCGKATPKGKFCMECGAPLAKKCPNCGQDVPAGGKFCLECGTKME
ncbi:MAG: zinc ribbon domain-containing protein, partial [Lachnospiraceae bacterium]|nr:zinc ribbon domain-containing protein [Lachnospiraceae bacterium]